MASHLFAQIEELVPKLDGWCVPEKACDFAAIILALRPALSVEVGVWGGRLRRRTRGPARQTRHDLVYQRFLANLETLKLEMWVDVRKMRSDQVVEPRGVGLLVIDGNHGEQAMADVQRFTPFVNIGGVVYLDDLNWEGGAVLRAADWMRKHGFRELFTRDQGAFFQRQE